MKNTFLTTTTALALGATAALAEEVRVYNWSDYIDEALLEKFEAETGISVAIVPVTESSLGERMTAGGWRMPAGSTGLIYATRPLPVFAGPTEVRASHPMLRVRVVDSDGIELASGDGRVRLEPAATAFGVTVELIADRALDETISGVGVEITAP